MRLLIIEDDSAVARAIVRVFESAGHSCTTSENGEDGLQIARLYEHDAIILDLTLPDLNGEEILRRLRAGGSKTPVIILTGRGEVDAKVEGLAIGADDYVTKPFNRDELLARIYSVVRRSKGHAESAIAFGDLVVDANSKMVLFRGRQVHLTPKEYGIVELLALRKDYVVSRDAILDNLYNGMDEPDQAIIDVYMSKLRRKLKEATGSNDYIVTIRGRGYQLRDVEGANANREAPAA